MDYVKEVLIVSDSASKDSNCSMYDLDSGNLIETYKEGHSGRNALDFIGHDYLISAFEDRPKMKIWRFGHAGTEFYKITAPGVVSALAVSKCGQFCIAGVGPTIYVWEVASGNLESHIQYHLQDITCVRFSSDGSHFLTGGKDGLVLVFLLADIIKKTNSPTEVAKPQFTWTDHMGEVTDIYVGCMGIYSRVATTSKDTTCRIYELDSGYHLCTIHMKAPLTSVTMDMCEYFLFLGTDEGNIYRINLFNMTDADLQFEDVAEENAYIGHKNEITSLCMSHSGYYLVSGSKDKHCRLWDSTNFSCVRQMTLPGQVTNVITSHVPPGIKNKSYLPHLCVDNFKRVENLTGEIEEALINISNQNLSVIHIGAPDQFFESRILRCPQKVPEMMKESCSVDELSVVNQSMYAFALGEIFDSNE